MRLANLLVAFAAVAVFGQVLSLFAFLGKVGYEQGWWGAGPLPISIAVTLALGAASACVVGLARWIR